MRTRMIGLVLVVSAVMAGVSAAGGNRMSYIYKRGDSSYTRISGSAMDRIGAVSRKYGSEFVWVRVDGRSYVIRDSATLAAVRNAFREVEAMEPSLRDVEKRLKPFERQMEGVEERMDALSDQLDDEALSDSERDAIERKMHDVENDMRQVERQMEGIEREMERLENESEKREAVAEDRFEEIVERAVERGTAERVD